MSNADKLEWFDISEESYREYVYADGSVYLVPNPLRLNVKKKVGGDSHRIVTKGMSHYVAPGWIAIRWMPAPGTAPIAF